MTDKTNNPQDLAQFKARTDQLISIYKANAAKFANECAAIDRAQATLDEAKQAAAATIARREQHTRLIEEAHQAGALNERERGKILERYAGEYATPDIDDAKKTLDLTWDQFGRH